MGVRVEKESRQQGRAPLLLCRGAPPALDAKRSWRGFSLDASQARTCIMALARSLDLSSSLIPRP